MGTSSDYTSFKCPARKKFFLQDANFIGNLILFQKRKFGKGVLFLTTRFAVRSVWKEGEWLSARALLTQTQGGLPRLRVYVYMSKLCHSHYNDLGSLVILYIFQGQIMIFQSKLQWNRERQCTCQCSGCRCPCWMAIFSSTRWQLLCSLLCSSGHHTP